MRDGIMKTIPTDDIEYKIAFLQVTLTALQELQSSNLTDLNFTDENMRVIEYYYKYVSHEPVMEHETQEACLDSFLEALDILTNPSSPIHQSKWDRMSELVQDHRHDLEASDVREFEELKLFWNK